MKKSSLPSELNQGSRSSERPKSRKRISFQGTILLVILFSVAVHLLFLLSFGGVTLFKGRVVKMPFTSERVAADKIIEAVAPPTEEAPPPESPIVEPMAAEQISPTDSENPLSEVLMVSHATPIPSSSGVPAKIPGSNLQGEKALRPVRGKDAKRGPPKASAFFGIKIDQSAPRIVLLLDTSNTMFKRKRGKETFTYDYGVIKHEAEDLIQNLDETARFNVVLYEGGAVACQNQAVPLTEEFKKQAIQWIVDLDENPSKKIQDRKGADRLEEGGGTRLDTGFKLAFRYDPTTVFLLTDGEANAQTEKGSKKLKEDDILPLIKQLQDQQKSRAVIHVVHYLTNEAQDSETDLLKAIARQGRGKVKVVEAKVRQTETAAVEKDDPKGDEKTKRKK